ncbi:hypothetical protein CIP107539_00853 [Corynebacterium diphtheriae]|uniref:Uncharacterized protein n=1 Tax=Corynebacterium diphtheriae TaxID=1717 RepID=A0A811G066_CORDP|nr:hypothetical protein CIP107509_02170 [Corynebacterium diphtheriae]SPJ40148.1 hypothetical protein CHUV2995_00934 [Corynebacterium diphtheriae subsp. lausannense]CAB0592956.1 hypothetical protein CIP107558_00703 [Corynebacterium diphtheriae]CAB0593399.1 hypothetical protein CIP107547_00870 [Corynebacterium diphtheriae]CAB0593682.1 hypothetical protein CIP107539_00853 [Corynebacterium diphtheriae]
MWDNLPWWLVALYATYTAANRTLELILSYKIQMKKLDKKKGK